jgi:hypothetical protein
MSTLRKVGWVCLLGLLLLPGCGASGDLSESLPEAERMPGWRPSDQAQIFDQESLYELVNGQADSFFAYGFQDVVVRNYENASGEFLRIEIWRLATPSDAYGLFTSSRAGQPVDMGNGGDSDPGRRLDFWQERYFVRVFAPSPLDDALLEAFAQEVSVALPQGGLQPQLVERLPADGLVVQSPIFFHSEISIQDRLWLGGQNLLNLGPNTDGVLARYTSAQGLSWLLLVEYPDATQAATALRALKSGDVPDLVLAETQGALLGAVLGQSSETTANRWLQEALLED